MALKAKAEEEAETSKATLEPWVNEPESVDQLLHHYIIEGKFAGRVPGTTLFLVQSKNRDGTYHQVVENQKFKLFLVPRLGISGCGLKKSSSHIPMPITHRKFTWQR